jgi:hypothetical protein
MDTFAHYLFDLGCLLKREALGVKQERSTAAPADRAFLDGKLLAYNVVLSLMLSRAKAFDMNPRSVGLEDFDPNREL